MHPPVHELNSPHLLRGLRTTGISNFQRIYPHISYAAATPFFFGWSAFRMRGYHAKSLGDLSDVRRGPNRTVPHRALPHGQQLSIGQRPANVLLSLDEIAILDVVWPPPDTQVEQSTRRQTSRILMTSKRRAPNRSSFVQYHDDSSRVLAIP